MLLANLFDTDSIESIDNPKNERNSKTISYSTKNHDIICNCTACPKTPRTSHKKRNSQKETITTTEATSTEITLSSTTTIAGTTANITSTSDVSDIGTHQNISLLSSRNSSSFWRNNHGILEGSCATCNGSSERSFSGNYGDSKRNSEHRGVKTHKIDNEKNTSHDTRDYTSGYGHIGDYNGIRRSGNLSLTNGTEHNEIKKFFKSFRRNSTTPEVENKVEIGGNETKSSRHDYTSVRPREYISENQEPYFRESFPAIKNNTGGEISIGQYKTNNKQIHNGYDPSSKEDQRIISKSSIKLNDFNENYMKLNISDRSYNNVIIIDGYSVATDKHGNHANGNNNET